MSEARSRMVIIVLKLKVLIYYNEKTFYNISSLLQSHSHIIKLNKWTACISRLITRMNGICCDVFDRWQMIQRTSY